MGHLYNGYLTNNQRVDTISLQLGDIPWYSYSPMIQHIPKPLVNVWVYWGYNYIQYYTILYDTI
jgi:hypothetical protein